MTPPVAGVRAGFGSGGSDGRVAAMSATSLRSLRAWSAPGAGSAVAAAAVAVLTAILLALLLLPVSVARATDVGADPVEPPASRAADLTSASPQARGVGWVSDWGHVLQVVDWLRYRPPPSRVVYLFGGSAARESVVSERSWAAQLGTVSGSPVVTYVVAKRCQTFVEDKLVVDQLPEGRGVALISVGATRITMEHDPAPVHSSATRSLPPGPWYQHHYDTFPALSAAEKRGLVTAWLRNRYGQFVSRYPEKLVEIDELIQACLERGLQPVLLEMPLNLPVVGHAFDEVRAMYAAGCLELATKYDIEYIRFVSKIGLRGTDFYDLQHLLPSGRSKWQTRLSQELVSRELL
jgi:hypothetical protein